MITAKLENKSYLAYQVIPHATTKVPPSEVMIIQKIRYTILSVDDKINKKAHNSLDKNDKIMKLKQRYYDNRHSKTITMEIADKVLVLQKIRTNLH